MPKYYGLYFDRQDKTKYHIFLSGFHEENDALDLCGMDTNEDQYVTVVDSVPSSFLGLILDNRRLSDMEVCEDCFKLYLMIELAE